MVIPYPKPRTELRTANGEPTANRLLSTADRHSARPADREPQQHHELGMALLSLRAAKDPREPGRRLRLDVLRPRQAGDEHRMAVHDTRDRVGSADPHQRRRLQEALLPIAGVLAPF